MNTARAAVATDCLPSPSADPSEAFRWPILTEEDETEVLRVLRDGQLSVHPVVDELEADYRAKLGVAHAIAHCNGTAGLLASYFALDLKPGDEVIVPTATWWSTVLPLLWLGVVPVFADCERERAGLCPVDARRKITSKTKAIAVTHLWGLPAKMTELRAIAREHELAIVEDASHAHGATWRGKPCGTLGDIGVFSLQGDKLAPAGEGGIVVTDRDDLAERVALLGDVVRIGKLDSPAARFAATSFGFKTRIAPLSAAVAKVQLRHLDARNAQRNANLSILANRLEPLGLRTFQPPAHVERVYFQFPVINETGLDTAGLIAALKQHHAPAAQARYPLLHEQPFFTEGAFRNILRLPAGAELPDYDAVETPIARELRDKGLLLPNFQAAAPELIEHYALAFERVCKH